MIKIDLITGFLGSGKTTFIKRYVSYLKSLGQRICILENDFGAVNVDMLLLQDVMGEQCELEMVAGGCDADCHKRRFKTKLISMGMRGFDRVLIEPSGIFDVDEFYDSLREELTEESEYLLASQLAGAGQVLLSKVQEATEEEEQRTIAHMNRVLERFGDYTYIACELETGRTHQIRVHMASIHHPLLGDNVYGPARCPWTLQGQTLHAKILGIIHPRTGKYMEFDAPLPEYFENLLKRLRKMS